MRTYGFTFIFIFCAAWIVRGELVTFRYEDADADNVAVVGEFNSWKPQAMERDKEGVWTYLLDLPDGTYGYKFIVGDPKTWLFDPNCNARKIVGTGENSAIIVGDGIYRPAEGSGMKEWTFRFLSPGAEKVAVVGSFNNWNTTANPMEKDVTGTWTHSVALPAGETEYKFLVDGKWMSDPEQARRVNPDDPQSNSIIRIEGMRVTNDKPVVSERLRHTGFSSIIRSWLLQRRFKSLESMAKNLRENQVRWPEGTWKLNDFYDALNVKENGYEEIAPLIEEWMEAFPESVTPRIVKANVLIKHAWKARGSGWASTVTEEGWKDFRSRLEQAREVLLEAQKLPTKDPVLLNAMQTVHLGLDSNQQDREAADAEFAEAIAAYPEYYNYYFARAYYLLPRWHGETGEWEKFAATAADASPEGDALYARIAWGNSAYYENLFKETDIDWPRMRAGFEKLLRQWPDTTWNLNAFMKFAIQAGDLKTARALQKKIGDTPDILAWGSPGNWRNAVLALNEVETKDPLVSKKIFGNVSGAAVFKDGKKIAVLDTYGNLTILDLERLDEPVDAKSFEGERGVELAVSNDGNWLAAGFTKKGSQKGALGKIRVFHLPEMKESTIVEDWHGWVTGLAFTPDSSRLIMSGGILTGKGDLRVWDTTTGKVANLAEEGLPYIASIAVSPDGKQLVTGEGSSLVIRDLNEQKVLRRIPQNINGWINALDYSPDGKQLAQLSGSGINNGGRDSHLLVWDTSAWTNREIPMDTNGGGPIKMRFLPDGHRLATGGLDNTVRLWNIDTGEEVAAFPGHANTIMSLAIFPDGKKILSGAADQRFMVWKLDEDGEK